MKKTLTVLSFFFLITISFANDTITGSWRGTIIGHTDNKDYFLNASIESSRKDVYVIHLKIFTGDYIGEFSVSTTLKNQNRLYIDSFQTISEFPFAIPHIGDCFTGYFLVKRDDRMCELDLYRNAIIRKTQDFVNRDTAGNYIPDFECFTSVLLQPVKTDTTYAELERRTDSIITAKKNKVKEVTKRKVIASKEWTVRHEKITLRVWDNNKEDGDIISLKFNDTWILNNFRLKKEKYVIQLQLKQKDNQLLMFAENLGSIPPNTAAISIDDNEHVRTFMLNSDMITSESVKIILQK